MKYLILLLLTSQALVVNAATYKIGSTRNYVSPNALYSSNVIIQDGDIIEIDAEDYIGRAALAVWRANNLIIRGVNGRPHLQADGQYILGKGIWVCAGNNITVENVEFSGATVPDENGAGIRLDGIGLMVKNCYFHNNENGILTNNSNQGTVLIEYSEFAFNGFGRGFTHNLYIGRVERLIFRYNYSHHAIIGHNLKSRANENYIYNNRIMDENTGNSSRLIDLSNGGFSIVLGNLLMQGPMAENNNLVGYGKEGLSNSSSDLYLINNTMVNKRRTCIFVDVQNGTTGVMANNIITGLGTPVNGVFPLYINNLVEAIIDNVQLFDEINFDFHLTETSPAIDYGLALAPVNGIPLTPDSSYMHPVSSEPRHMNNVIDAGAYEYDGLTSVLDASLAQIIVYPNPVIDVVKIDSDLGRIKEVSLYRSTGEMLINEMGVNHLNVSKLTPGLYIIKIVPTQGESVERIIIKK